MQRDALEDRLDAVKAGGFARQYSKASKRGAILGVLSIAVGMPSIVQNALGLVDFAMTQRYSHLSPAALVADQ